MVKKIIQEDVIYSICRVEMILFKLQVHVVDW